MRDDRKETQVMESKDGGWMMERDEDENEERGQMDRRHKMVVKLFLMLGGG